MLLAIDVGNSQTVSGVFQGDEIRCHWRIKTDRRKTADELAADFYSLFQMNGLCFKDISGVVIASVVPTQQLAWLELTRKAGWPLLQIDSRVLQNNSMRILTDHPEEVGADRIANAAAAFDLYGAAVIVVDFGTAITFDCVAGSAGQGQYLGGAIVPGIAIAIDALAQRTAKLPRVDISTPPRQAIGKSTVEAIKSGILFGYGSMVDGLVAKLKKEFGADKPKVIATGGMAELVTPYTESIEAVEPMLTLQGLRLLYEKNIKAS